MRFYCINYVSAYSLHAKNWATVKGEGGGLYKDHDYCNAQVLSWKFEFECYIHVHVVMCVS